MTALWFRLVLLTLFSFAVTAPAHAGRRVALVIGNGAYEKVQKLVNPTNDAVAIANMLKAAGFDEVELRRNLGIREMRKAISDFSNTVRDADTAVVYYSGHGIEVDGINYLIPIDALLESDIDVPYEAYSLDNLLKLLEPARRLRLVMLDACRDNPFVRSMKRSVATRSIGGGLAAVEPTSVNTLIGFAAKAGSYALDGEGGLNSPYATAVLNNLAIPGLDLRIAFGRVRDEVLKTTERKQEPFVYGSLGGQEIYIVPPVSKAVIAADELTWSLIKETTDDAALKRFVAQYPDSPLRKDAEARIAAIETARAAQPKPPVPEDIAWNVVKDSTDPEQLRRFVDEFPSSTKRMEAEQRVAALVAAAAEAAAWERAQVANKLDSYKAFLDHWPSGQHQLAAKQKLDQLAELSQQWNRLRETRAPEQLRRLLADARGTEYEQMIEGRLDSIELADKADWSKAEDDQRKIAYLAYLNKWPDGDYRSEATARLAEIAKAAEEWNRIKGKNDEASLQVFLKRPYIAEFEADALAELVSLERARNRPMPYGLSALTADALTQLIDGKTIRFFSDGSTITFGRQSSPSGKLNVPLSKFVTDKKFLHEGYFSANVTIDGRRLAISGIGGIVESAVDNTASLMLLQVLGTDRGVQDLQTKDRLYSALQIYKVEKGYVCTGSLWSFVQSFVRDKPSTYDQRCEVE